jgi:putative sterol carrier protein
LLSDPARDEAVKVSYWLPAIQLASRSDPLAEDVDDIYEFRIADDIVTVRARGGQIEVCEGPAESPDLVVHTDPATFIELGRGRISPAQAIEVGKLSVEGDAAASERCAAIFATREADPLAAAR